MPRRPSGSKPTPIRSATSTRIPLYHHGNVTIHCRSTWTRTNPRARHLLRTLAHMKDEHPCRGPGLRSWLLQRVPGQSTKEAFLHDRRRGYGGGKLTTQACMLTQGQSLTWHALHRSRLLTRVLLRALLGRRRLAFAVILHGPTLLVTASPTVVGAIGLDRRVLRVGSVAAVERAVSDGACTTSQAIQSGRPPQQRQDGQTMIPWRAA